MRPRTALSLVTTRAPMFFARSQSAARLTLASGAIVSTLVPFRLRMLSMVIVSSHRVSLAAYLMSPASGHRFVVISVSYREDAVSEHRLLEPISQLANCCPAGSGHPRRLIHLLAISAFRLPRNVPPVGMSERCCQQAL